MGFLNCWILLLCLTSLDPVKLTAEELTAKRRIERKESKIQKSKLKQAPTSKLSPVVVEVEDSGKSIMHAAKPKAVIPEEIKLELEAIENMEHLQLMNEEAFFLTFGLGCLDVLVPGVSAFPGAHPPHFSWQLGAFF